MVNKLRIGTISPKYSIPPIIRKYNKKVGTTIFHFPFKDSLAICLSVEFSLIIFYILIVLCNL